METAFLSLSLSPLSTVVENPGVLEIPWFFVNPILHILCYILDFLFRKTHWPSTPPPTPAMIMCFGYEKTGTNDPACSTLSLRRYQEFLGVVSCIRETVRPRKRNLKTKYECKLH